MQQAAQAAAPVPETPKDIDPTGTYSVSLAYQGQPITVTMHLGKADTGGWIGTVLAERIPAMSLLGIKVSGKKVTAGMTTPDGALVAMDFTIDGTDLAGSWKSAVDGSPMTGKKLP